MNKETRIKTIGFMNSKILKEFFIIGILSLFMVLFIYLKTIKSKKK